MTNNKKHIIAVDFDGTIVTRAFPAIGNEIPLAFETLKALKQKGHKLILYTCREGYHLSEATKYCLENGVEFDAINENTMDAPFNHLGRSRKPYADLYLDDKSFPSFQGWQWVRAYFNIN